MERDRERLNQLVKSVNSVLACPLDSIEEVGKRRILAKLLSILHNSNETVGDESQQSATATVQEETLL